MGCAGRRDFLKRAAAGAAAAPFVSRIAKAEPGTPAFDPAFGSATDAARAIRTGRISARELVAHVFARIGKHNPKVNAFVTLAEERALVRARAADEGVAAGRDLGPLHGVPITVRAVLRERGSP